MHQTDCSLHCSKICDPAVREALDDVFFIHHGSVPSCTARGKTNPTSSKAVSTPRFV
jgi:hypothetical protein